MTEAPQNSAVVHPSPAPGSPAWVVVGAGVSGVGTYAVQVVVGRAVGLQPFADFSLFWAASLIAALGFFLPLEQETARRVAGAADGRAGRSAIWRRACVAAGGIVLCAIAIGALGWQFTAVSPTILISFTIACLGYGLQFPARGVLAGRRRLAAYSAVVTTDALLRLVAALALWLTGVKSAEVFALVVAASSLFAGLLATILAQVWGPTAGAPVVHGLVRNAGLLVVAASCMQLLLNSGTLVARVTAAPADEVLAAHLISFMTLARLPVFVFQSLQAVYVARLAGHFHSREAESVRRVILRLAFLAGALGVATAVGSALLGPWVIGVFGPGFRISSGAAAMIGSSIAFYLLASVANDISVALGGHRRIITAWPIALGVAVVVIASTPDLLVRSTLPLMVAALTAATLLIAALRPHLTPPART